MERLKMKTPNLVQENIKKIEKLFPECVTEHTGGGQTSFAVDFDKLRQELSGNVIEDDEECYRFTWPGKKQSIVTANAPINKTLRPCRDESVDFDNTENLYIEGDNLDILKLLREDYLGKVKMIYIDPPYNTGNDFVYKDEFLQSTDEYIENSGQVDYDGNRLIANTESNGRFHTDWLNMIYPRLKLARDFLSDDGVIFISIDDNEVFNLKKICDEIFGSSNFVVQLAVQLNPRGRNLDIFVAKTNESVLVYVKNYLNSNAIKGIPKDGKMVEEYNKEDSFGRYREIGLRNRNQSFNPTTRPNLYYPLYVNEKTSRVSTVKSEEYSIEVFPDAPDGTKTCWTWMKSKVEKENDFIVADKKTSGWRIFRKDYLIGPNGKQSTTLVKSLWIDPDINNDYGKKAIKDLFGENIMSFPKSPWLIKKLLMIGSSKNSLIMDMFSGSATTAEAVMRQNKEDGGIRKFIMMQLPESVPMDSIAFKAGYSNVSEIGKERIRRVGKKIIEEQKANQSDNTDDAHVQKLDVGFRVLKLDSSNMKDVYYKPSEVTSDLFVQTEENIKEDRTDEDLLFQVMLEMSVPLSAKICSENICGKKVLIVDDDYLIACFDKDITDDVVTDIAKRKPQYFVMRDSSAMDDNVITNFETIFQTYSKCTVRKIL
jgi:adenine-specific DNA-methyltransferase